MDESAVEVLTSAGPALQADVADLLQRTVRPDGSLLLSEDRRHIVIRPLAYVPERMIERYARAREFPIIPCTLCGSQPNMQRLLIKGMLRDWEEKFPGRVESIFSSIGNIAASQLADPALFDFAALESRRALEAEPQV